MCWELHFTTHVFTLVYHTHTYHTHTSCLDFHYYSHVWTSHDNCRCYATCRETKQIHHKKPFTSPQPINVQFSKRTTTILLLSLYRKQHFKNSINAHLSIYHHTVYCTDTYTPSSPHLTTPLNWQWSSYSLKSRAVFYEPHTHTHTHTSVWRRNILIGLFSIVQVSLELENNKYDLQEIIYLYSVTVHKMDKNSTELVVALDEVNIPFILSSRSFYPLNLRTAEEDITSQFIA